MSRSAPSSNVAPQCECGFEAPADRRIGATLAWRDVNEPAYGPESRGAAAAS